MNLLSRLLAATFPPATCRHSGKLANDCAGCQADRSFAPTWPEDHIPFTNVTLAAPATWKPVSPQTTDDWRAAA
jgi:hypothetical protein